MEREKAVGGMKVLALVLALGTGARAGAATITVDLAGAGDFRDIQSAIDAAANGDTVLVKPGEYVIAEPITFKGKAIAVKSEGGSEATTIRMTERLPIDTERGSVVVFENGEGESSVLEGFSITGGIGTWLLSGESWARCGKGILCIGSSPSLVSCIIYNWDSCEFCWEKGGGLYCQNSSPTLTNCTLARNWADEGGGLYCRNSSPNLTSCTISGNETISRYVGVEDRGGGGGMYCCEGSSPILLNCTISDNTGLIEVCGLTDCGYVEGCGGVYCDDSFPTLTNCMISENTGSGVHCRRGSSPTLRNCTISGNSPGGLACDGESSPRLTNCIIWGNRNTADPACGRRSHCMTDQDPLFIQPGRWDDNGTPDDPSDDMWIPGDYRLQPGSPAIDAGISVGAPTTDMEGRGRPCGAGVDIGAYEFGECASPRKFVRGNVDRKGGIDIGDPIYLLAYLFLGGDAPGCLDAGDINDDGSLDITDAVYSLNFQFLGGDPPRGPFPECGVDPWIDGLDCGDYPPCE